MPPSSEAAIGLAGAPPKKRKRDICATGWRRVCANGDADLYSALDDAPVYATIILINWSPRGGKMVRTFKAALLATTAAAFVIAGAASAADEVKTPPPTVAEVIVTAQKRSERLQDVPVSVTAVTSQSLIEQNLVDLSDYYSRIPGLSYQGGSGLNALAIRGVTTGLGTNSTVAVTIDDVPFGSSTAVGYGDLLVPDLDPADLERIEVLRGPQGTLYGASSLGGLLQYVTASPDTHKSSGRVEVDGESVDHGGDGYGVRGSANLPIVDGVAALRISGFYRDDPGYIFNTLADVHNANTDHSEGGRVALLLKPAEGLTINLAVLTQQLHGVDGPLMDLNSNYTPETGDLQHATGPGLSPYDTTVRLYDAHITGDLGFADLTSITGYGEDRYITNEDLTNQFGSLLPLFSLPANDRTPLQNGIRTDKFSQELQLASKGHQKLDWLVGLFYTHEQTQGRQIINVVNPTTKALDANFLNLTMPSTVQEEAVFADVTYHFTDKFDVQVGGRYSYNRQKYSQAGGGLLEGPTATYTSDSSETAPTWLFTPRYRFSHDLMAYLRIATGYRVGGPNTNLPSIPKTYSADNTINYEIGVKGEALEHRLSFDGDLFLIDWNKIQLEETDPVNQLGFFGNGGHAHSQGFEGEVKFVPWEGGAVGANLTLTDAALTSNLPTGPTATIYGLSGDRLPYSAKVSGNVNVEQDFDLPESSTGFVGGAVSYVGQRYGAFSASAGIPRFSAPAYTTLDLRTGVRHGPWALTLFVRNVTDERGWSGGVLKSSQNFAEGFTVFVIQPQTMGLSLSRNF